MIGYNRLGTNGRLGNQMFQYAALKGIASWRGYEYCIPPADHPTYADYALFEAFKMEGVKTGIVSGPTVMEQGSAFDYNLFDVCKNDINLEGFFQTEKYFQHIASQVRKDFTFKDEILSSC